MPSKNAARSPVTKVAKASKSRIDVPTVGASIELWFTEVVAKRRQPSTAAIYRDIVERVIYDREGNFSELSGKKLGDVTTADMSHLHAAFSKSPYEPNRALAVISSFFVWTETLHWRAKGSDPCAGVAPYAQAMRERFLTPKELRRLGRSLKIAEGMGSETVYAIGAIRLLLFTGLNSSEIVNLKWSEVDFKNRVLRIANIKSEAKVIRLGAPAQELLKALPRKDGHEFVFSGQEDQKPIFDLGKSWARIRDEAKLIGVRLQDLRKSFAPLTARGGTSRPLIGLLLGATPAKRAEQRDGASLKARSGRTGRAPS